MTTARPFRFIDGFLLLAILAVGLAARAGYVYEFAAAGDWSGPWHVQDLPADVPGKQGTTEQDALIANLKERGLLDGFRGHAPLAAEEEVTAHVAPLYPVVRSLMEKYLPEPFNSQAAWRWVQVLLGTLSAGAYFLLARRAFASSIVATLAGLLCALNPFWIINVAELNDGTLATFLLATSLALGARCGQEGGALASLLYGILLTLLALVRAALLPFACVGLLWFLLRSRRLPSGWLYALLAFLGFIVSFNIWFVRNFQQFHKALPVVDTAWWHIWVGNNPRATGGPFQDDWLGDSGAGQALAKEQLEALQQEGHQPTRYEMLAERVLEEIQSAPDRTLRRRLQAAVYFFTGQAFFRSQRGRPASIVGVYEGSVEPPWWLTTALYGTLLGMLILAMLGWRWSYAWRRSSMPLQLAVFWVPVPYMLSHADWLHGPRLPLDGPLLCLAAFALASLIPGAWATLHRGEESSPQTP